MSAVDLCVFLTSYSLIVAIVVLADVFRGRQAAGLISTLVALAAIITTTVTGFYLKPGENYLQILAALVKSRDSSALVASAMGFAAALVWAAHLVGRPSAEGVPWEPGRYVLLIRQAILSLSIVGVVICTQAFVWKDIRGVTRDPPVRMHSSEFILEKMAGLDQPPIRIAIGQSDQIYVSYDYFENSGTYGGGIIELTGTDSNRSYRQRIVADSPLLIRCYGLAAHEGDLYVSRSGISPQAAGGSITYQSTGAVTRLRDLDGDGYFEFADDIVTGLPGTRGPATMHQNNGICFDGDGNLFVTTASAGDRTLASHPWEGAVLRVELNRSSRPEVFAAGFRNPFGIVIGPDDQLFVTDNDADENPGDELNHIVKGAHYGHPYVVADESSKSSGFQAPIIVGEHEWNFLGVAYADSTALPEQFRHCLYIADFMQHAIWRIKLRQSGDSYQASSVEKFATISSPVDIAVTDSGEFFVVSRNTKNLYRIRPREPKPSPTSTMTQH